MSELLSLLLALLLARQEVQPPKTVNGQVLGKAEDFKVIGPARVCMSSTSIDLRPDEVAYLAYLGIHWGSIRVVGPRGTHLVSEGDIWAVPKKAGTLVPDAAGRTIVRHRREGRPAFLLYSRTEYSEDEEKPVVWIRPEDRTATDTSLFKRITYSLGPLDGCKRHFDYGWDVLLGEEEEQK